MIVHRCDKCDQEDKLPLNRIIVYNGINNFELCDKCTSLLLKWIKENDHPEIKTK